MDKVSIIVVNWNGKRFLSECLDGLRRQIYQPFSVILIDNGSSDGSVDFVNRNYPEVEIIALTKNLGFAAANNIALKTAQTEYVALLNNDAVPHPIWLNSLIEDLESYPEAGFAASKMLFYDKPDVIDRAGDAYSRAGTGLLRGRGEAASNYNKQEWIFGACAGAALYRTRMLKDIGLFDDDFFLLYEDVDLGFRAQLKGYKCVYVPEAIVYHKSSSSIVYDSPTSVYYSHRNLEWVYLKNMPPKLILKTIWLHIIYDIAAFFFFTANGRIKEFIKAKLDALKGLRRILKKRTEIQRNKRVNDDYIWGLLERELFFPRLTRRMQKN
ncbi:MAG TPA: glycosyltransferase family 2 protein [Desulfatiglandales bacterium]|nr:glycosyltransferase family 2 protein [Desulfatiglandales bacterium]